MRFRSWRARTLLVLAILVVTCAVLVLSAPRGRCALRMTPGYVPYEPDTRVYYVPGSEEITARFAEALPEAVERVESRLSLPLRSGYRVYVCPSHKVFARHLGQAASTPVRGTAFSRDIWVSPKAFAFHGRDTTMETLAHELAHLHFGQYLGWLGRVRLMPGWFQEGLADWVADTGEEIVSREDALAQFRKGNRLVPDVTGNLPLPKTAADYGLTWPAFHAQSRMLVEHLRAGREESFRRFVVAVLGGSRFDLAFREHYGRSFQEEWGEYVRLLEAGVRTDPDDERTVAPDER